jgi:enoyl-CoA hydratase/carnithine racemase
VGPSPVSLAVADGVAVVTLARPPVNALDRAVMQDLRAALERIAADPAARAVVIASGVPGTFSAGADIRELVGLDAVGCAAFVALGHDVFDRIAALPRPVVAAINGVCLGGGLELALACDLRVAAVSAQLGQPEINLGVVSGWGGTQRLPRLLGKGRGLEMLLLGEPVTADRALAIGLVNRVVPDAGLQTEARALARKLAGKSAVAVARVKASVERGLGLPLQEALREEARCYVEAYLSEDAREGVQAFLEKRPPRFTGPPPCE